MPKRTKPETKKTGKAKKTIKCKAATVAWMPPPSATPATDLMYRVASRAGKLAELMIEDLRRICPGSGETEYSAAYTRSETIYSILLREFEEYLQDLDGDAKLP
jgi:hypothetical protein